MTNKIEKGKISSEPINNKYASHLRINSRRLAVLDYIRRPPWSRTNGQVHKSFWRKK